MVDLCFSLLVLALLPWPATARVAHPMPAKAKMRKPQGGPKEARPARLALVGQRVAATAVALALAVGAEAPALMPPKSVGP
jgi:hypothetical protein